MLKKALLFSLGFFALFAQVAQARADDGGQLHYFKNYFVTGDFVVAGVGLRGKGVNGFATGKINMSEVPCTDGSSKYVGCSKLGAVPADIVAAFLYWETEETSNEPSSTIGYFRGNKIVGKVMGTK
jgi:hypothetical protein